MTDPTVIGELTKIEIEHLVGESTGSPLVRLRAVSDGKAILVGALHPAEARTVALNLIDAASRAEAEADLVNAGKARGLASDVLDQIVAIMNEGSVTRKS